MDGLSSSSREPIASPRLPEGRMLKGRAKNAAPFEIDEFSQRLQ
jgi:hypothetical protein